MVKITTLNVNGVRAAARKGLESWLEQSAPDVLTLQEVRADPEILRQLLGRRWALAADPCLVKGRAGVAVALRRDSAWAQQFLAADTADGGGDFAAGVETIAAVEASAAPVDTGRWLELRLPGGAGGERDLIVVSAYLHSGELGTERQEQKMAFLEKVSARLRELAALAAAGQAEVVVTGDFNIVRSELDIKNWKPNHNKTSGVLDTEIAYLERWFTQDWVDVLRAGREEEVGPYTWWSLRGRAFDNDAGWRLDYHQASPALAAAVQSWEVYKAPAWDQRFSDHAPVSVNYMLPLCAAPGK